MSIVFCHNVHNRVQTLRDTIKIERNNFPSNKIVVGYNLIHPGEALKEFNNIDIIHYNGLEHKIGCTNGFISTVKQALIHNPDVIIFSHDDVYISNVDVVLGNVDKIRNEEYDVICRKPHATSAIGSNYYMMECIYLSKKAAETVAAHPLFQAEGEIDRDIRGSISPEVFLYNLFSKEELKVIDLTYNANAPIEQYNTILTESLGFFHMNIGIRGWGDGSLGGFSLI